MISPCKKPLFNEKQMEWIRAMASDSPPAWPGFAKLTASQRSDLRKQGVPVPKNYCQGKTLASTINASTDFSKLTAGQRYELRKQGLTVPLFPRGAATGEAHPRWRGDAVSNITARERTRRWFKPAGKCAHCGAEKTEFHHKDSNPRNNSPSNVLELCRRCHMIEDGRHEQTIIRNRKRKKS